MYLMNKLVTTNSEEANGVISMIILRSIISLKMTEGFTSKYVKQHMGFFLFTAFYFWPFTGKSKTFCFLEAYFFLVPPIQEPDMK